MFAKMMMTTMVKKRRSKSFPFLSCNKQDKKGNQRFTPWSWEPLVPFLSRDQPNDAHPEMLWRCKPLAGGACVVASQPDCCGGSEPLSWLWCRDTFAPVHLRRESAAEGYSSRLLLNASPLRSLIPSNPLFFFCSLSPWQQAERRLCISVVLTARQRETQR